MHNSVSNSKRDYDYLVVTSLYEGPLDLLLQLIERAELDITKLALSQVTDQYLQYLNQILNKSSQDVSEFIVIASKLIQIKSEALLPRSPTSDLGEEDMGDALVQQLREYKRFKKISKMLSTRLESELRNYPRLAPSPRIEPDFDMKGISLQDLIIAGQIAFSRVEVNTSLGEIVTAPRITIQEKIKQISDFLFRNNKATFGQFFLSKSSRIDVVVTFLAMLELIRLRLVYATQAKLFDEIFLEKSSIWEENSKIELEFGE